MKKLFELPIYAFSKVEFEKKIQELYDLEMREKEVNNQTYEEKLVSTHLALSPYKYYDYNHIIGVLCILYDKSDVYFCEYDAINMTRYRLKSNKKIFLEKMETVGMHFRHKDIDNDLIINKLNNYVKALSKKYKSRNRYINVECFDNVYKFLDYKKMFKIV